MGTSSSRPRLFLDTNVIFSALYSRAGVPNALLEAFSRGNIVAVVSVQVRQEIAKAIHERLPSRMTELENLLGSSALETWPDSPSESVAPWLQYLSLSDAAILAAAIAARPDMFVTGDRAFFHPEVMRQSELRIVTPAEAVGIISTPCR